MKRDATELKNRLLYCPEKKHQASTRITANRLPNALAKNGFCLNSNQPQFTKGKGKTKLFTQSQRRQHKHKKYTLSYNVNDKMHLLKINKNKNNNFRKSKKTEE